MIEYLKEISGEKCGVFGVAGSGMEAARTTFFGLYALQHRGQQSSGISASDGERIKTHKELGLVAHVYDEEDITNLNGFLAIGQNRYSTSGGHSNDHSQPVDLDGGLLTLAHNGNLPSTQRLEGFLDSKGIAKNGRNDSELMHLGINYFFKRGASLEDSIREAYPLFEGAFSVLVMTKDKVAAVRDSRGIRPFSIGRLNGGFVFSSETCAIDTVKAQYIGDVAPGELVVADGGSTLKREQLVPGDGKLDIFEFVYFSRPDSTLLGRNVYEVRKNLGRILAREHPMDVDLVVPIPDSAIPAAIGYAEALGLRYDEAITKNRYIHRTFIRPTQKLREQAVRMKLNPIAEMLKGRRVILIDDSKVRGTTSRIVNEMVLEAGAREVHEGITCPPYIFPDPYGIDTPNRDELIAVGRNNEQIRIASSASSVSYLSKDGMIAATGLPEEVFTTHTFTGEYPVAADAIRRKYHLVTELAANSS